MYNDVFFDIILVGEIMKEYLYDYIEEIDEIIDHKKVSDEVLSNHLIKISFFQHERQIHLLVTLAYALMCIISLIVSLRYIVFCVVGLILAIFLIFYVRHYFNLEDGVQYLYKQYDTLKKLNNNK